VLVVHSKRLPSRRIASQVKPCRRTALYRDAIKCRSHGSRVFSATINSHPGRISTQSILWSAISGSQLGVGFRRQAPIGNYIADFVAPGARLVVEVDGGYHAERGRADARRDRDLARLGYRVLHLDAAMVQHRVADAVALVRAALAAP